MFPPNSSTRRSWNFPRRSNVASPNGRRSKFIPWDTLIEFTSWWFQPNGKILVKIGSFPQIGENKTCLKPPPSLDLDLLPAFCCSWKNHFTHDQKISHNKTVGKKNDFLQAFFYENMKRTIFLQLPGLDILINLTEVLWSSLPHNIPCMEYMEYLPTWIAEYFYGKCWVNIPVAWMVWVCFLYWEKHHRFPPDKTRLVQQPRDSQWRCFQSSTPTSWPQDPGRPVRLQSSPRRRR